MLFVSDLADMGGDELPEQWQNRFETRGRLDRRLWETILKVTGRIERMA